MRFICILICVLALAVLSGCDSSEGGVSSAGYHFGAAGSLPGSCNGTDDCNGN